MPAPLCVVGGKIVTLQSEEVDSLGECLRGHVAKHPDCQCFLPRSDFDGVCMRLLFAEHPPEEFFVDS